MDPRRFDALAQSLAGAKTRRGVLGTLAALGAGVLGARATDAQVTQRDCGNVVCGSNPAICKAGCVCCTYPNGNSRCRPPGTCAPGTEVVVTPPCFTVTGDGLAPNSAAVLTLERFVLGIWVEIPNIDGVLDPVPTDSSGAFVFTVAATSWCTSGEFYLKAVTPATGTTPEKEFETYFAVL